MDIADFILFTLNLHGYTPVFFMTFLTSLISSLKHPLNRTSGTHKVSPVDCSLRTSFVTAN